MNCSKKTLLRSTIRLFLATAMLMLTANASSAAPITGAILLNGGLFTDSNDLENATELDFNNSTVLAADGDFLANGVGSGDAVTFITNPLSLNPTLPTDLWSVGDFIFTLATLLIEEQTATALTISGEGTIASTIQGLDPVEGFWRLTTQTPGLDLGGEGRTMFSFSSSAISVPEPSSFALIALGLGGLGMTRRRLEH